MPELTCQDRDFQRFPPAPFDVFFPPKLASTKSSNIYLILAKVISYTNFSLSFFDRGQFFILDSNLFKKLFHDQLNIESSKKLFESV